MTDPGTFEAQLEEAINSASDLDALAATLEHLLNAGVTPFGGRLMFIRQRVDTVKGLRIVIFPDEHPPPHFHVQGNGINASFSIVDCTLLKGTADRQVLALVQWWYQRGRPKLVTTWNATRPTDCPVGPIVA